METTSQPRDCHSNRELLTQVWALPIPAHPWSLHSLGLIPISSSGRTCLVFTISNRLSSHLYWADEVYKELSCRKPKCSRDVWVLRSDDPHSRGWMLVLDASLEPRKGTRAFLNPDMLAQLVPGRASAQTKGYLLKPWCSCHQPHCPHVLVMKQV